MKLVKMMILALHTVQPEDLTGYFKDRVDYIYYVTAELNKFRIILERNDLNEF